MSANGLGDASRQGLDDRRKLYETLRSGVYSRYPYRETDLGCGMKLVSQVICRYWKPRYLVDNEACQACEFMDAGETLMTVGSQDIAWETLEGQPGHVIERARELSAHFPTQIGRYVCGVAQVSWQLNPDGMYYMDDDGFGMTDDDEVTVYGYIDKSGRVVERFRMVSDTAELVAMQSEAEAKARG